MRSDKGRSMMHPHYSIAPSHTIVARLFNAMLYQELGARFRQHGDQRVVAQVVGAVDVGDADRHFGFEAEDVVRESELGLPKPAQARPCDA